MEFIETKLYGAFVIEAQKRGDDRGFFAEIWGRREFEERGLEANVTQCAASYNVKSGTLRGMHYQRAPHAQTRFVRCVRGAIYDVMIDLRPDSTTFGQWVAAELTAENYRMLYIPRGFAHGFQTLTDNAELTYLIGGEYRPAAEAGVRWNDPFFGIEWPLDVTVISPRDANHPDFYQRESSLTST
jgi:dTDP-4-dehydrorhamnose 3,5-epimerase